VFNTPEYPKNEEKTEPKDDRIPPAERIDDDIIETPSLLIAEDAGNHTAPQRRCHPQRTYIVDDAEFIQNVTCIPGVCFNPKRFIHDPENLADSKGFTLLASFPGSGNTWTRVISESIREFELLLCIH